LSVGFSIKVTQSIVVITNLSRYGGRPIKTDASIFTNGPPVELVSVAERLKAVTTKVLFCYEQGPGTQTKGVQHGVVFASQVTEFYEHYEFRVTMLMASRIKVKVLLFY